MTSAPRSRTLNHEFYDCTLRGTFHAGGVIVHGFTTYHGSALIKYSCDPKTGGHDRVATGTTSIKEDCNAVRAQGVSIVELPYAERRFLTVNEKVMH
jgi:hypothetical protein